MIWEALKNSPNGGLYGKQAVSKQGGERMDQNNIPSADENYGEMIESLLQQDKMESALRSTSSFAKLMSCYQCAMMEIETKLNVLKVEYSLRFDRQPISSIKTRRKNQSAFKKTDRTRIYADTVKY